jgi:hypothetical protein
MRTLARIHAETHTPSPRMFLEILLLQLCPLPEPTEIRGTLTAPRRLTSRSPRLAMLMFTAGMFRGGILGGPGQWAQSARRTRYSTLSLKDVACGCRQRESTSGAVGVLNELYGFERDGWVCGEHGDGFEIAVKVAL